MMLLGFLLLIWNLLNYTLIIIILEVKITTSIKRKYVKRKNYLWLTQSFKRMNFCKLLEKKVNWTFSFSMGFFSYFRSKEKKNVKWRLCVISDGLLPLDKKTLSFMTMAPSPDVPELCSFQIMTGYYRNFFDNY